MNRQGSAILGNAFPSFSPTGTTNRDATSRLAVNIELDRITQKDVESGDKFELEPYHHQSDKNVAQLERNGVHVVIPQMTDGTSDTLQGEELTSKQEVRLRDLHRQL
jgi:hypothetical protein